MHAFSVAKVYCDSHLDSPDHLALGANATSSDGRQTENAILVPPYYNLFGEQTIAVVSSQYSAAGVQPSEFLFVVETKATSWHDLMQISAPPGEFAHTEVVLADRKGIIYVTFPTNYMQPACLPGWGHTFDPQKVVRLKLWLLLTVLHCRCLNVTATTNN